MSQSHLHPPRLPTQSQQPNLSTGGDKPRTQTGADYRNQGVATWAPASSTSSSSHPTPEPPMFGAPPMFYDPAQSAQQQDQRGMADYDAWAESFAQGGQYANAGAAGYAQAGSVPHLEYGQQQQPMQGMAVPMDQGHGQYGYQQYAPDTHDPFNQAYSQQTPMNTSSDRPQRSLPRSSGRGGYASVTPPNMSSMPDGTAFSQQQQPHLNFPAQDEYLFHPQPSQAQPQAPARPGMQTRSSAPSVPTVDSIPQQRFQFAEYRHPDQLVAPAPVPSSYTATGSTPTSDINSFSSSPVSWGADQSQSEHTTSQTQSTTRKQGSATKPASQKTASAPDKGKKRARVPRDSDSSDDDEMGSFAINVSMAPSGGHGGPTRLPGACKHCKKLKMKCDFPKGDNTCRRCKAGGISCIVEGRKPRNAPNKREYLLAQIRQKDIIIEKLLRELHNPYAATPLSIASYRMATSPSDHNNRNVIAWLDRLEESVQAAGRSGGTEAFKIDSRLRPGTGDGDEESDDEDDTERGSANDDDAEAEAEAKLQALPDATVPLGLLAHLSLDNPKTKKGKKRAGAEGSENEEVGVANETYFLPGPAFDLSIRASLIENHSPPEILVHGLVTPDDVDKLFDIFYTRLNVHVTLLDREIHTVQSTFARCPFLFTVVCAISSRYYKDKSEIYPIAMHFARRAAADGLLNGWKSVELAQAYILLSTYAVPARRWEEDRSWLYIGLAIRIATDLNLHQLSTVKPRNDQHKREILNQERLWLICHNLDRSMATQFGKPSTIREDYIIRNSENWYKRSPLNHQWDCGLSSYTQLLRIMARFHEEIYSDPNSPTGLNQNLDFREMSVRHDESLTHYFEEWTRRFKDDTDMQDPACAFRASLLPFLTSYSRLVMYSFGFQQAYKRGIQPEDQTVLDNCFQAAKSVILCMIDTLCPSGYMRFSPDGHFIFASFASAFLLKLMRPEFKSLITSAQESEIFDLIGRLIQTLGSPEIAIDERHTPKLHARFLAGLLTKHRRDTATAGRIQTQQQPPPSQVSPHSQVSSSGSTHTFSASGSAGTSPGDTAFPGGSMGYAGEGHLILGSGQGEPVYQEDTAYAAGTGPLEVFDFGAVAGQGIETLGALQALQNPSYWRDMMMPGYSWPENNDSYGLNGNMGGFGQNFGALQTAEVGLFG